MGGALQKESRSRAAGQDAEAAFGPHRQRQPAVQRGEAGRGGPPRVGWRARRPGGREGAATRVGAAAAAPAAPLYRFATPSLPREPLLPRTRPCAPPRPALPEPLDAAPPPAAATTFSRAAVPRRTPRSQLRLASPRPPPVPSTESVSCSLRPGDSTTPWTAPWTAPWTPRSCVSALSSHTCSWGSGRSWEGSHTVYQHLLIWCRPEPQAAPAPRLSLGTPHHDRHLLEPVPRLPRQAGGQGELSKEPEGSVTTRDGRAHRENKS